ncbi:Vacuolar H+transporting two-sector ATPase F subunit [Oceanispirochaeta crateris]|jgi:V/A-type H+-transporting ATPase subunit F|uniref:Vacuolar H+transporting two-sector ATPase F subunit n=1 Tax=Oceanispirochaeta crateris TaxID=2518645 RepID=A0A5C1QK58_9SPIO|nr:V-type ATP synthase subunit F [Oceanispirochaeta crateris]QEN06532.1 Vacuolar H+transporting two-sector ATPase F subunit [Oceanispirochaeta crateris]
MKYYIIGDEDTVLGFEMVGVRGRTATNENEAALAFSEALEDRDIGIIIISEAIADLIRHQVDQYMFTMQFPLIVEIPDRNGRMEGKPGLREMVNAAIGIKI